MAAKTEAEFRELAALAEKARNAHDTDSVAWAMHEACRVKALEKADGFKATVLH